MRHLTRALVATLFVAAALAPFAAAQKAGDFPPGTFNDGRAYSMKDLEGKAVVLFFYEQNCPRCRETIPARNEVVAKYRDKPVKFIAIAAGDTSADAKSYLLSTKLAMPVFADTFSVMEARYGMKVSMQNIFQVRVVGPDGNVSGHSMEPDAIDRVLSRVKWKYKDGGYDAKLDPAIEAFEWNQYADGMRLLKPLLKNGKKDVAESAKKLHDAVLAEGQQWFADGEKANGSENPIEAYDLFAKVATAFAGDELGKKAADAQKKLATTPAVKDELAARGMYAQLCQGAAKAQPTQRADVAKFAMSIAKKYPKSPTGLKCEAYAKELEAGAPAAAAN